MNYAILGRLLGVVVCVLFLVTAYLYNFAVFCRWRSSTSSVRMALFADPQMEGDTKLLRERWTGWLDLKFNDYYTRHIVRTIHHKTRPTHVGYMGDIFSYQWLNKQEFGRRVERFRWVSGQTDGDGNFLSPSVSVVNVSGNHDIGYGQDVNPRYLRQWEQAFGAVNYQSMLTVANNSRTQRMVVLNTQNLDKSHDKNLQNDTWSFLQQVVKEHWKQRFSNPVILLMHIPLYKPEGVCMDPPSTLLNQRGEVIRQNMLPEWVSKYILYCLRPTVIITGHDHEGCRVQHTVVTQEAYHSYNPQLESWCQSPWEQLESGMASIDHFFQLSFKNIPISAKPLKTVSAKRIWEISHYSAPEITMRSVMGDYGGNAGLFEITALDATRFTYRYQDCPLGHHLIVRVVLIADILVGVAVLAFVICYTLLPTTWHQFTAVSTDPKKEH
ncbi:hypothetical protein IWQ62_001173 [Dispira parvispora]|uniref:Calcineurin-like phosphoesterase domain-containing protein n=1 Tax=Dispira parvispora TaxID=1520584 RepID=A0A9W8AT28_9FUNG|nr:hypothetical protein IWQ62_001173 [Dispira parvispora]